MSRQTVWVAAVVWWMCAGVGGAAGEAASPAGFWGQLTGAVVSRAEDGASLEIRVQTVSPDDKRNKLQNPAALVGTTLRVIRPTNPGQASYTRRIRELAVGDRLWLKAYAGPEGRALNAQAFYRFESDADRDQILLVGDSILDWWMPPTRIAGVGVINRSVAGDGSWGILANLDSRILDARPKLLVLHIGANDLLSTRAEATAGRIGQILDRVIAAMPDLPIVLCTVMPQDPARVAPTKIRELNTLLDALARKHRTVSVVDLFTPFANPDGAFDASLFVDRVHPNPAGYERLAELLTAAIETRLTNDAKAQLIETFDRAPDGKPLRWELYVDEGGIDAHGRITLRDGHAVIDYGSHYLFVTDQVALEQPLRRIEWSASMEQDETVHPVIQIDFNNNGRDRDDPVYVSVRGFSGSGSHVLESADAEWVRLDFMPQSQARNNAGQLAGQLSKRVVPIHEGAIVAVGFYAPRRTTAHRFGPIQVYAQALVQADPAAAKPPETIEVQRPIDHRTEVDVTAVTGGVVDERAVQHTIDLNPDSDLPAVFAEVGKSLADGTPTRVRVADGLYRQNFPALDGEQWGGRAIETPLIIEGTSRGAAVFSGADVFKTEWTAVRAEDGRVLYYTAPWPHNFGFKGHDNGPHDLKTPIGHRMELLVYNGQVLKPVMIEQWRVELSQRSRDPATYHFEGIGDPAALLSPGTFGVVERDDAGALANTIFLCPPDDQPIESAVIEVGMRERPLTIRNKHNVVLRNLTFQHAKNAHPTAAIHIGTHFPQRFHMRNVVIDGVDVRWTSGLGMNILWCDAVTVRNCDVSHNGGGGITTGSIRNMLWEDNQTNYNNWRGLWGRFVSWSFGGVKHHRIRDGIFRRHTAIGNFTRGFWFDIDHRNLLIEDVICVGNIRGLFLEICPGPLEVRRALLVDDTEVDLEIHANYETLVKDSIIWGSNQTLKGSVHMYFQRGRGVSTGVQQAAALGVPNEIISFDQPGPYVLENNVIGGPNVRHLMSIFTTSVEAPTRDYIGRANHFWPESGQAFIRLPADLGGPSTFPIGQWFEKTGERDAQVGDPGFVDPASYDFRLRDDSPLTTRQAALPTMQIDPDKIREMRRMREWVQERKVDGREAGD